MLIRPAHLVLLPCLGLLGACGDDPAGDSDSDTELATTDTDDGTSASPDTDTDPDPTTTGVDPGSGTDPGPTTDPGTGTDSDSDSDSGEPSPYDGEPLPPGEVGVWEWVDFPESRCRDGSPTGIGVRPGSGDGLVIYFEGGGACFNGATCGINPSTYGGVQFAGWSGTAGNNNFFSTDPGENPVADWSFVYVPYCTGDVHAGARPDAMVPGVLGPQQFVGYTNVGFFLNRVVPTYLGGVDRVLVAGQSAGGFGAAFNYDRIAEAFPNSAVSLLDDSGPPMSDMFMAPCLQKQWRDAWGLDFSIPQDCPDCFPADGGGIVNLAAYLGQKYPDQRLGLISSLGDATIRFFFGFGADDCGALLPNTPGDVYAAGLADLRDNHLAEPADVWGTFYIDSEQHTWIGGGSYLTTAVDGVRLVDWVRDLVGGSTSHVAP